MAASLSTGSDMWGGIRTVTFDVPSVMRSMPQVSHGGSIPGQLNPIPPSGGGTTEARTEIGRELKHARGSSGSAARAASWATSVGKAGQSTSGDTKGSPVPVAIHPTTKGTSSQGVPI